MSEMYLDPPHLSIAMYSDQPEVVTFSRVCEVMRELGCKPLNLVEVVPRDREFELLSDLADVREILTPNLAQCNQLIAGEDPKRRVLRAGFVRRKSDTVLVEYQYKTGADRHPVAISLASRSLGLPESLWSAGQRKSAYAIAVWARAALEVATSRCGARYGFIGVESSLPTPSQIKSKKSRLATELFVSRQLLDRKKSLEDRLRQVFSDGEVVVWENGVFLSGWAPFNSRRTTLSDPAETTRLSVELLKGALP